MSKRENTLPYAPIGRLIQEASGKRVSKDARVEATKILENLTEKIVLKAQALAQHSGRKTIKAKDITLAYKQVRGNN